MAFNSFKESKEWGSSVGQISEARTRRSKHFFIFFQKIESDKSFQFTENTSFDLGTDQVAKSFYLLNSIYCFDLLNLSTDQNNFRTFLHNLEFCFPYFRVNSYFIFSTVLPKSIYDTFIGHP
jgi:hypothetical protein